MAVVSVIPAPGVEARELLRLAGAAEAGSEHPVAVAIAARAAADAGALPAVTGFASLAGLGVEATVDGRRVVVGRPSLLLERGIALGPELATAAAGEEAAGRTSVAVSWDGAARGVIGIEDALKPTSVEAVGLLRALDLEPVLLTGDNPRTAGEVARAVGIERVVAGVLPAGKEEAIADLQAGGEVVAMVGDGVNDAPALARSDLGMAIGTGTDVAIEASDLTLVSGDLRAAVDAIRLARRVLRTIRGNLFWAFAYNVAAIPLAVAGLLDPMIAAAAMAFSSVFVVTNSLRLRRFRSVRA
jgi:Cu+-exporting ATPase